MRSTAPDIRAIAAAACLLAVGTAAGAECIARSGAQRMPLVELYTSEGCSSCPPADRWLSEQVAAGAPANFLAFHVDYWDRLGWRDRYADAGGTARQRSRVEAARGTVTYTPQVMVGRDVQVVWRDPAAWQRALTRSGGAAQATFALRLQRHGDGWRTHVDAAATADGAGAQLWLVRHVDARESEVMAGENSGRLLRHDRVVRQVYGPWPLGREPFATAVDVPADTAPWGITAFAQRPDGEVLQSLTLPAASCAAQAAAGAGADSR